MEIRQSFRIVSTLFVAVAAQSSAHALDLIFDDAFDGIYNYRIDTLSLRDPHVFFNLIGCTDVTDAPFAGFSINSAIQSGIQDDSDGDGLLDASYLLRMRPLDQTNGASSTTDI